MDTFKSWLIANLEIVYYLALALILGGAALFGHLGVEEWTAIIILSGCLLFISLVGIKHGFGAFMVIVLFLGLPFLGSVANSPRFSQVISFFAARLPFLIGAFIVAVIIGIVIAIYAYRNFDDVVSLRFLYRNSEVSVFEEAWKYAFNRQFAGFMLVFGLVLELLLVTGIKDLNENVFSDTPTQEEQVIEQAVEQEDAQPEEPPVPEPAAKYFPPEMTLDGCLSTGEKEYPIIMMLNVMGDQQGESKVKGFYRYASEPKNKRISLTGTCHPETGTMRLVSKELAERFDLEYSRDDGTIKGTWTQFETAEDLEADAGNYKKKLDVYAQKQE